MEDIIKSKIKIDFFVLVFVVLYDLWILEFVFLFIFDGFFFMNWFIKLLFIFMKFCLIWCKLKWLWIVVISLVKLKVIENGYFFKFIYVYFSIIYICIKLMVI